MNRRLFAGKMDNATATIWLIGLFLVGLVLALIGAASNGLILTFGVLICVGVVVFVILRSRRQKK